MPQDLVADLARHQDCAEMEMARVQDCFRAQLQLVGVPRCRNPKR